MSSPFVGEVRPWACNFAPIGWAFCWGQLLSITQYSALFSLLGTYYGGNGTSNFQLPDLRGRVPLKFGTDPSGNYYNIGGQGGSEQVMITQTYMPPHTHAVLGASASSPNFSTPPAGSALGSASNASHYFYAPGTTSGLIAINPGTVSVFTGGTLPHTNIQPYQAINWCIALIGVFPSRN